MSNITINALVAFAIAYMGNMVTVFVESGAVSFGDISPVTYLVAALMAAIVAGKDWQAKRSQP